MMTAMGSSWTPGSRRVVVAIVCLLAPGLVGCSEDRSATRSADTTVVAAIEAPTSTAGPSTVAVTTGAPVETWVDGAGKTCLRWDDRERCWVEHRPAGLRADEPAPLVIDLHGWGDTPERQRELSGFEAKADEYGFTVVWPKGIVQSWNAGRLCCDPAAFNGIDDPGFLRQMIEVLIATEPTIDPDRVYVTGLSNGCAMAQRFAFEAADIVAAGACMSHFLLNRYGNGAIPASFMTLHGTADDVVDYTLDEWFDTGARPNVARLADIDDCVGEPVVTWQDGDHRTETYADCPEGREIALTTIAGGGHHLYGGADTDVDTTEIAWQFMSRFRRVSAGA